MISALSRLVLLLALCVVFPITVHGDDADRREVTVRCDKGRTIGDALAHHRGALTIRIVGTCDEHVTINRDDVSLVGAGPGAGIHGPQVNTDTVAVTGDRFVLDGLSVTGGRNAVVVSSGGRAMIRNCTARATGGGAVGGIGIFFTQGANGTVDNCDSTGNPNDGLALDAATATITNSRFRSNGRTGILVFHGSTARIGMTNSLALAPNIISDNASNGIHVTVASQALIAGNTVSGNGVSPTGAFGRFGVVAFHSRINLPAGNVITGNFGAGVALNASTGVIGDPGFGILPPNNIIRGNSTAAPSQGINVLLNSTLALRNATVDANNGTGVAVSGRSVMTMVNGAVTGHTNNGIQLSQGGAVIFQTLPPFASVPLLSGNVPFDLRCLDTESSYTGTVAAGAIDPACTGF
jgi:parallel beta-helix repeat protein